MYSLLVSKLVHRVGYYWAFWSLNPGDNTLRQKIVGDHSDRCVSYKEGDAYEETDGCAVLGGDGHSGIVDYGLPGGECGLLWHTNAAM